MNCIVLEISEYWGSIVVEIWMKLDEVLVGEYARLGTGTWAFL